MGGHPGPSEGIFSYPRGGGVSGPLESALVLRGGGPGASDRIPGASLGTPWGLLGDALGSVGALITLGAVFVRYHLSASQKKGLCLYVCLYKYAYSSQCFVSGSCVYTRVCTNTASSVSRLGVVFVRKF